LNLIPIFFLYLILSPLVQGIVFSHIGYMLIYALVPVICVVVGTRDSVSVEAINTKKVLPLNARGIYFYTLPMPLFILGFFLLHYFPNDFVAGTHIYSMIKIGVFCGGIYLLTLMGVRFILKCDNKGREE